MESGKKKLTLTELKRYLPMAPPEGGNTYPEPTLRYLASPAYNNLSVTEQTLIDDKYRTAYRNYYSLQQVKQHIYSRTEGKYSLSSI